MLQSSTSPLHVKVLKRSRHRNVAIRRSRATGWNHETFTILPSRALHHLGATESSLVQLLSWRRASSCSRATKLSLVSHAIGTIGERQRKRWWYDLWKFAWHHDIRLSRWRMVDAIGCLLGGSGWETDVAAVSGGTTSAASDPSSSPFCSPMHQMVKQRIQWNFEGISKKFWRIFPLFW